MSPAEAHLSGTRHGVTVMTLVTTVLYGPVKSAVNVVFDGTTGVTIGYLIHELPGGIWSLSGN